MTTEEIKKIVESSLLKADHVFEYPPVCLEITGEYGKQIFATLGNFSTILAPPKVGKTTALAVVVIALLSGKKVSNFIPSLPASKNMVLWIDTEQANPECINTIQFISENVTGDKKRHPENLKFIALRRFDKNIRLAVIEYLLQHFKNIGFLIIDGIRDLVTSINDEKEATLIADKLLRWSQEYNIHISGILHENKGDSNGRGHIGTELMNKSETVISLEKAESNGKRTTVIKPKLTRHKDFEPFAFTIENGMIVGSEFKNGYQPKNPKVEELTFTEINEIMKRLFTNGEIYGYSNLIDKIKEITDSMFESFGVNKCTDIYKKLKLENYIIQREGSKNWCFNRYPL
jgi:hypothetical protein